MPEHEKPLMAKSPGSSTLNWVNTPSTGSQGRSRAPFNGVHRIRVDFKRDHDVEKVWEAGGLGLLTSVPVTPRVLCFLCASSGNVEVKSKATLSSVFSSKCPPNFLYSEASVLMSACVVCLLPGMLWTVPSLLPGGIWAPSPGAVWELVLPAVQILPGLWTSAPEN